MYSYKLSALQTKLYMIQTDSAVHGSDQSVGFWILSVPIRKGKGKFRIRSDLIGME